MTPSEVATLSEQMDKEIISIRKEAWDLSWYSRGGLSYQDALNLSATEREFMSEKITEHLETTKKSGLPFF